jgi:hypothetical protein
MPKMMRFYCGNCHRVVHDVNPIELCPDCGREAVEALCVFSTIYARNPKLDRIEPAKLLRTLWEYYCAKSRKGYRAFQKDGSGNDGSVHEACRPDHEIF